MQTDINIKAVEFVSSVSQTVLEVKPEATSHEIIGVIYQILSNTIEKLKHEQLPESREVTSGEGAIAKSEQVQGDGETGRAEEDRQRLLNQQASFTKSGKKKRRNSGRAKN